MNELFQPAGPAVLVCMANSCFGKMKWMEADSITGMHDVDGGRNRLSIANGFTDR